MQGISRQVAVLNTLAEASDGGLSTTELCSATGLAPATVHRLLEGMSQHGILVQEDTKRWRLGPRLAFWAGRYLEGPTALEPLRRLTRRLSEQARFFSYLTRRDGGELVCVAVERSRSRDHFFVQLGSRVPVLSAAAAKAILAHLPEEVVCPIVELALIESGETRTGPVTLSTYLSELSESRKRGYATCMEELEIGVSAVSAPVFGLHGRVAASLTAVATTGALVERWDATIATLTEISGEASMTLGYKERLEVEGL